MVERICPTCMGFATLGAEKSTTIVCGALTCETDKSSDSHWARAKSAHAFAFKVKFKKPGPAIEISQRSSTAIRPDKSSANSRGFLPSPFANIMAMLLWKSPKRRSAALVTWTRAGSGTSTSRDSRAVRTFSRRISGMVISENLGGDSRVKDLANLLGSRCF